MADQATLRITREIKQIQKDADLSLTVRFKDSDIRDVKALILGPPGTPYQFGFFEFKIKFGKEYPAKPPNVQALTTNGGRTRFNPNIYASGKVCLSILGTWQGNRGEEWSSAQGLESVLISIQSLMSNNPYENEPGFENKSSSSDKVSMISYNAKIRHETLRIAVIEPLELALSVQNGTAQDTLGSSDEADRLYDDDSPITFDDLRKRRFLWYFESYMQTIDEAIPVTPSQRKFEQMPFEGYKNGMEGHFNYPELKRRLVQVKDKVFEETFRWAAEGSQAKKQELGIAVNLQRQYEQIVEHFKSQKNFTIDLSLVDDNPFLWEFTYFGRPMTQMDGGIFKFKVYLSPRFPDEQPRVLAETPIFHIRVSPSGVLCYLPQRSDEMRFHIEAIVAAMEEESPPYDPRTTVNPEATKLFWGSADERKQYNRKLRRSVQQSIE
ncbi:ubiquitin conjugating enzyme [Aspergillus steynii IBT 23096]|uniref:Ubiquitin-conjugating enzyme E2 Z n=1 Tax=Aspergillus steynii IBT 23096 TaxID=1392250 RepID=A0A2I2GDM9_9EURO|nr:ubiquitin conjugating enzyme [Aspergillus steynii IBT 23096]PLB51006.1 ubiquitin conjugating enzyme [Aspergillus steynii IBT 23096]